MKKVDLAWATGYIEADGHIGFHKGNDGHTYRVTVSVYSIDLEPLVKFSRLFGCKVGIGRKASGNRKILYRWNARGSSAVKILKLLKPYFVMERKKRAVEKIIKFYWHRTVYRGKRWNNRMRTDGALLYQQLKIQDQVANSN